MRRILLGVVALGVAGMPARAQWTVIDPSNLAQAVEQVRQLQSQLQMMQQQYQQLQQTYQAISHLPQDALNQLGQQLNVDRLRSVLPDVSSVTGMMNGGQLNSMARRYLDQNRVYTPGGQDFGAQEMGRSAQSIANAQGLADGLYRSATGRIEALRQLEDMLTDAPDIKAVADIQARILAEQTYVQAQQVQAQALMMWQQSQGRNEQQRREEQSRSELDRLIEEATARGG